MVNSLDREAAYRALEVPHQKVHDAGTDVRASDGDDGAGWPRWRNGPCVSYGGEVPQSTRAGIPESH